MPAGLAPSFMEELESVLATGAVARRTEILRRVCDLFIGGAPTFGDAQISLFDDVMSHLVDQIETLALAELSSRLAPIPNAPPAIIGRLAHDDSIAVAGPVLAQSERLTDAQLTEIAATKSTAHLVHIAGRANLREPVTDVLVDRGGLDVASVLAENTSARLSNLGMSQLVLLAQGDDRLTEVVGVRSDIPPHLFHQLIDQATDAARERLMARAEPAAQAMIQQVVRHAAAQIGVKSAGQRRYRDTQLLMASLNQDTERTKSKISEFANANRVVELAAALAVLTGIPFEVVDRVLQAPSGYGTMVLCKAAGLDAAVVDAVMLARPGVGKSRSEDLAEARLEYPKLSVRSAHRVLRFWLARERVAAGG